MKNMSLTAIAVALALSLSPQILATELLAEDAPKPPKAESSNAQEAGEQAEKNEEEDEEDDAEKAEKKETFADKVKDLDHLPGYLEIYRDPKTGSAKLSLSKDQLNTPILYFAKTVNGVVDVRHFVGAYRTERLVEFRQYFDRLDVVAVNDFFYFDPENALSKASHANTSDAILVTTKVEFDEEGKILVNLDDILLNQNVHRIQPYPSRNPKVEKERFKLGKLSKNKTRLNSINNFPENTHVTVDYVFENPTPRNWGTGGNADPRFTTISLQHAFVKLPDNNFEPRVDDARVGYFGTYKDDQTTPDTTPYRDYITRWHLEKKDPSAAVSDPVKPITWWIENTTPVEWRETIKEGVLAWNSAFEKAGISNALEVKIQPDDADWSAEDVRYNVLRWTSSPRPPFGGYGPSLANPQTGEIIAADIMLEYVFMTNRWLYEGMFTQGTMFSDSDAHDGHDHNSLMDAWAEETLHCSKGHEINMGMALGQMIGGQGTTDIYDLDNNEILRQGLLHLTLHEVGHTLGLNHNMMASQLYSPKDVHNPEITQGAITGSVMDYAPINLAPVGVEQGDYYDYAPGPYDDWAIYYGYSPALDDPEEEAKRLESILQKSAQKALAFGNDADDMRAPGRHIDPRIMTGDMSSDAVTYAEQYIERLHFEAKTLKDKVLQAGESHQDLVVAANIIVGSMGTQANVMSRYIGGIYINRAVVGQEGYDQPFTPVPREKQVQAMQALNKHIFAPDAIADLEPLFAFLQKQRRGFYHYGNNEDPKPHSMLLRMQSRVMDHLLHPNVMMRITDSTRYGNEYPLADMLNDLTDAVFKADIRGDVNTYRQMLQVAYVERLIAIAGLEKPSKHDLISQATATYILQELNDTLKVNRGDTATKIHRNFLKDRMNRAFHKSNT